MSGLLHAGPTIITEGSAEQRAEHLPRILRGEEIWCQGFSEPTAGSDLASMRTRAVRDGDHYVVNGHKLWTSHAEVADFCELLVRTDPDAPKHKGISWLMVPMDTPGHRRPAAAHHPRLDRVQRGVLRRRPRPGRQPGGRGERRLAGHDGDVRPSSAAPPGSDQIVDSVRLVGDLAALAKTVTTRDGVAWEDRGLRREIGHLAAEFDALWALTKRGVSEAGSGSGVPGPSASVLKLRYTEARQRLMDVGARVLGRGSLSRADIAGLPGAEWGDERINSINYTIAAGTSQIQRNIVGERILGLPRER